ncbi:hypothetical protein PMZ80_001346 [Knufia obscura]|uniref:2-dehydropantoate 2-reductase n=1 Tax=Knufia obscura TaxID=1635080 RepID=A0ABR0S4C2_9EURO|nr:hypothetical protein PMZ80_001346 [Knufia obscura]
MEILIFGAGAIGAFYGSRLAFNKNVNVSVVCRSNYQAVKTAGFSITSQQFGNYEWSPARTFANASEARKAGLNWDYVIVSTKALPDVSDDSQLLAGLISERTAIVLIQNGIGIEEPYARRFPRAVILSAVTITSAAQPKHGSIQHHRWTKINFGAYPGDSQQATSKNNLLIDLLSKVGVDDASAFPAQKLQLLRWHKVAINAAFNPSSVLSYETDNPSMVHDADMYEHMKGVIDEVLGVALKLTGLPLPKDFATPQQILDSAKKSPKGSFPSMLGDWKRNQKMELEVILGNPIKLGREKGLDMPRLQTMYALLKTAQATREQRSESRL